jgi:hypothetical protein
MSRIIRIAVDQPSPSGDGLSTIDMGDNPADNDYKPESSDDMGGDSDLFSDGDLFGGDSGGGGLGDTDSDADTENENVSPNNPGNLTPEELFINNNLQTYDTLISDIKKIILDFHYLDQGGNQESSKIKLQPQQIEEVVQHLLRKGWNLDTLMQLSFHSKKNLDNLVKDVVERINKNVSSKIRILGILDKIEGGHGMTQANNATAFTVENGKIKVVPASTAAGASSKLSASEKLKQAKEKLGTAIIASKRTLKNAKDGINRINGLLYKRSRKANDDAKADSEEDSGEEIPEIEEGESEDDAKDLKDLDKEISTEISDSGSDFDAIVPAIEELTDAIKELKDSLSDIEPGEVSKHDFDEAEEMIGEAQDMEDKLYQVNEEVGDLQHQIAEAFSKQGKRSRKASKGKTYESAAKPSEDKVPEAKETETTSQPSHSEKEASKKTSFFDKFLITKAAKEKSLMRKDDISKVYSAKDILFAEQIVPAVRAGIIKRDSDFWEIPATVVAGWDNLNEPVNFLRTSGYTSIAESLMKRAEEAHQQIKVSAVGDVRSAKWTEIYNMDIGETSKVMDDRSVESNLSRGGDIDKGYKSTHNEFTNDSSKFPENFGDGKGSDGLASPMGDKNLQGKNVKAELSQEAEFFVRRAMEIAGEEQFKHLIPNPMAVAMTKEFMRLGLSENEAIQSTFRVLSEGFEDSYKLALNRGFELCKKSEQDLIRRSKEVATYKVALFDDEPVTAPVSEQKRVASAQRNPALRSGQSVSLFDEQDARINRIFEKMRLV